MSLHLHVEHYIKCTLNILNDREQEVNKGPIGLEHGGEVKRKFYNNKIGLETNN